MTSTLMGVGLTLLGYLIRHYFGGPSTSSTSTAAPVTAPTAPTAASAPASPAAASHPLLDAFDGAIDAAAAKLAQGIVGGMTATK